MRAPQPFVDGPLVDEAQIGLRRRLIAGPPAARLPSQPRLSKAAGQRRYPLGVSIKLAGALDQASRVDPHGMADDAEELSGFHRQVAMLADWSGVHDSQTCNRAGIGNIVDMSASM